MGPISIRRWQELYCMGVFERDDHEIRKLAGWDDIDNPLSDCRIKRLSKFVTRITNPFILDNFNIFFALHQPNIGRRFGIVGFLTMEVRDIRRAFRLELDNPCARKKWAIFTERYGPGEPEFECGHVRDVYRYIDAMADQFQHGTKPDFWPEAEAVRHYIFQHLPITCERVHPPRREGEHSYSVWDPVEDRRIMLHVARDLNYLPPGFQKKDAVPICGMYVFQEDNQKEKV